MFGRKSTGGGTHQGSGTTGAAVAAATQEPATDDNRLVVGTGLTFNGAIEACNHLMIAGTVTSDVKHCDRLEIAAGGSFAGTATVNDAEIAGQFEGELIVLGHLRIGETGRVRGRITYGLLSVETGGRLLGITESSVEAVRPQPRAVVVPLRPASRATGHESQH